MNGSSNELIHLLRQLQDGQSPFDGETSISPGSEEDALLIEAQQQGLIQKVPIDGLPGQTGFVLTEKGKRTLRESRA